MTWAQIVELLIAGGAVAAGIKLTESILTTRMKIKHTDRRTIEQRIEELHDMMLMLRNGQKIILHDRIVYLARAYIEKDVITHDNRANLITMHEVYHDDLDGNGNLDDLMGQVKRLPII